MNLKRHCRKWWQLRLRDSLTVAIAAAIAAEMAMVTVMVTTTTTMMSDAHFLSGNVTVHAGQYGHEQPPDEVICERNSCRVPIPTPKAIEGVAIV